MQIFKLLLIFLVISVDTSFAYELVIIQGLSREKQTFVTRNRSGKAYFEGQQVTFTSNNVSIIAKAKTITKEFTKWEIQNDFTDVPFNRGEIVTMYEAQEYLWALSPEKVKRKYIKNQIFKPQKSFESQFAFSRGLSETVSEAAPGNYDRGGYQFQGMYRVQKDYHLAYAFGLRYTREVINTTFASLINSRFIFMGEARYYFDTMEDFYNSKIGLILGMGFGQSRTDTDGQSSFGSALILPSIKVSLDLPVNRETEFGFIAGFEAIRTEESFLDNREQTTNLNNTQFGIVWRKHLK